MARGPAGAVSSASRRVGMLLSLVLALPGATACGGDEPGDKTTSAPAPTPVRTVEVTVGTEADSIRTSGALASRAEMSLAFKVPGYVAEILVAEDDDVRAGQVLARLRTDEVDARVRAAAARAETASRTLERMQALSSDSVVTVSTLEEATDAYEQAQAALQMARFDQSSATIRAPTDGRILRRLIEESEFAGAGVPAFRLGSTESGWIVQVALSDRDVVRISRGDSATVHLTALGGWTVPGVVSQIASAADPMNGTFGVEVSFEESDRRLRSGMVARVVLVPSRAEELSFLPLEALVDTDGHEGAVFVVEGDRVRRHAVQVLRIGDESVGLRAPELVGRMVVTDGAAYLTDGDRVVDRTGEIPSVLR